ncbi:MAG: sulfite exporter TauE/SafE family protein, partial [Oxalobacter sp.]
MFVFLTMLGMGVVIGFVGAGGAGAMIAILTLVFQIPVHTAVGTSLASMIFTTISGTLSHFREGNVNLKVGITVGAAGFVGAFMGTKIATTFLSGSNLKICTASMLIASAVLVYSRLTWPDLPIFHPRGGHTEADLSGTRFWPLAMVAGIANGLLSGTFGIGAAQFIQLTLLVFFGLPLFQ